MTLPDEMREALAHSGGKLVVLEDPTTHSNYVLLPQADYERIRGLLAVDDESIAHAYAAQDAVARSGGWDDPIMDDYNDYDQRKKTA